MPELTQEEAVSLVERHLVSPEFISDRQGRGLLLLDDESVSVMINEEDHIRIQVMHQVLTLQLHMILLIRLILSLMSVLTLLSTISLVILPSVRQTSVQV